MSLKKNPTISASGNEFLSEVLIAYQWDNQSDSAAIAFSARDENEVAEAAIQEDAQAVALTSYLS